MKRCRCLPIGLVPAGPPAWADRPIRDLEALEGGDCELELSRERISAHGTARQHESALAVACGIGLQTELAPGFARTNTSRSRCRTSAS
jgi:hypothetical protein